MPRRKKSERGANLVEMAFVAPFLILLLFGIIEFAWVFAQDLTVKHGAREGARLAAVAFGSSPSDLMTETEARMSISASPTIQIVLNEAVIDPSSDMDPGDAIEVTVCQTRTSLTGIMDWAFPATFTDLSSTVEIRAEQTPSGYWDSSWVSGTCP